MAEPETGLEEIFRQFCSFGDKDAAPLMDGTKFSKLCRDTKLLDRNLTTTDVDIIFAKSKPKTERKMTLEHFEVALGLLAEKKYPGDPDGVGKLKATIASGSGPLAHGVTVADNSEGTQRMTDTSKYTGTHKLRFDENGKGRGLVGRDSVSKGPGMSPGCVSKQTAYVTGYKHEGTHPLNKSSPAVEPKVKKDTQSSGDKVKADLEETDSGGKAVKKGTPPVDKRVPMAKGTPPVDKRVPAAKSSVQKPGGSSSPSMGGAARSLGEKGKASSGGDSPTQSEKKDIFDRLTDPSTYHATHKHRFDSSGKGRGLEGRDSSAKGAGMSPGSVESQAAYVTGYKNEGTYGKAK